MSALALPTRQRSLVALIAEARHQSLLLVRDPGPFVGYTVMPLLLITVLRPLYARVGAQSGGFAGRGIDQAVAGMAVMFSLFALKVVGASLLNERAWHTWDRLQSSPAASATILAGKALPMYAVLLIQQVVLFGFAAIAFGFRPDQGWWPLAGCAAAWSACVLLLGTAASTLARSPAQLSAAGDLLAILTTILAGALVPSSLLPGWLRAIAPASPGYWAVHAYRAAIIGQTGELVRPLSMMALFGLIGVAAGIALDAPPAWVTQGRVSPAASIPCPPCDQSTIRYNGSMDSAEAGRLLRRARREAGLSQVELAERAAVSQSVVSAYESGSRQPSVPTLARLVAATGLEFEMRARRPHLVAPRLAGPLGMRLRERAEAVKIVATQHGLSNVRVFGSVARGEDHEGSDIDLLADIPAGMGLLGLARAQRDIEDVLGAPVDLVPAGDLKPPVAEAILVDLIAL